MMILYHMSDFLKVGTELTLDYKKNEYLIDPFVKALNISTAMFQSMLLKVAEGTVPKVAVPKGRFLWLPRTDSNLWSQFAIGFRLRSSLAGSLCSLDLLPPSSDTVCGGIRSTPDPADSAPSIVATPQPWRSLLFR